MEKKVSDLEHQLIKKDIKDVSNDMHKGFGSISEAIESGFEMIRMENKHYNQLSKVKQDEIIKKQDLTNGRITRLEKDTNIIRTFYEHKWLLPLCLVGLWAIYNFLGYEDILRYIKLVF